MDFNEMFQTWKKVLLQPGAGSLRRRNVKSASATLGDRAQMDDTAAGVVYGAARNLLQTQLAFASAIESGFDAVVEVFRTDMLPPDAFARAGLRLLSPYSNSCPWLFGSASP